MEETVFSKSTGRIFKLVNSGSIKVGEFVKQLDRSMDLRW